MNVREVFFFKICYRTNIYLVYTHLAICIQIMFETSPKIQHMNELHNNIIKKNANMKINAEIYTLLC